MKVNEFNIFDKTLSEDVVHDIDLLQYMFYDLADDVVMNGWVVSYDVSLYEIKEDINALLLKYHFNNDIFLSAFSKDFENWEMFYQKLDDLFQVVLKENNL